MPAVTGPWTRSVGTKVVPITYERARPASKPQHESAISKNPTQPKGSIYPITGYLDPEGSAKYDKPSTICPPECSLSHPSQSRLCATRARRGS